MSRIHDIAKLRFDFLKVYGREPNRVLMDKATKDALVMEVTSSSMFHPNFDQIDDKMEMRFMGMRVVVDPWAASPECALAREES